MGTKLLFSQVYYHFGKNKPWLGHIQISCSSNVSATGPTHQITTGMNFTFDLSLFSLIWEVYLQLLSTVKGCLDGVWSATWPLTKCLELQRHADDMTCSITYHDFCNLKTFKSLVVRVRYLEIAPNNYWDHCTFHIFSIFIFRSWSFMIFSVFLLVKFDSMGQAASTTITSLFYLSCITMSSPLAWISLSV